MVNAYDGHHLILTRSLGSRHCHNDNDNGDGNDDDDGDGNDGNDDDDDDDDNDDDEVNGGNCSSGICAAAAARRQ